MRSEFKEYYLYHEHKTGIISQIGKCAILKAAKCYFSTLDLGSENWHKVQHHVSMLSSSSLDSAIRSLFYEVTMKKNCDGEFYCLPFVCLNFPQSIFIGHNVFINRNVNIVARDKIIIGDNVMIGPNTIINSGSHNYSDMNKLIREQGHKKSPITICNNVFIGGDVFILPGVTVGEGAVVGAGSIVTKNVEAYTVVAGNPAKIIKRR